ncbi:hypothetical protein BRAO375_3780008 [Bradyrhizobium sp. ORS 375]|nr:hypothetical protein BRAO375_3780008 [Bradyrhizobium sp. ORS 375]
MPVRRGRSDKNRSKEAVEISGGPGRTRTCNQTVMSGRISISFVDFPAFSYDFKAFRIVSFTSFLVRNWCGYPIDPSRRDIVGSTAPPNRTSGST